MEYKQLIFKLEKRIDKLEKTSDFDKTMKYYDDGKNLVNLCQQYLTKIEKKIMNPSKKSNFKTSANITQIIERLDEINQLLSTDITIEQAVDLFEESRNLEHIFNNKFKEIKINYIPI